VSASTSPYPLPSLREVRAILAAILPMTGWLPPSGPFRVYDMLSPARGNPDEARSYEGGDVDRAYLRRQVERSDWRAWRAGSPAWRRFLPRPAQPWTIGDAIDRSSVLRDYPLDGHAAVVLVEIPLVSLDRTRVILRAQTQGASVEDHERRFRRRENGPWTLEA
jgi:hypothetical protein